MDSWLSVGFGLSQLVLIFLQFSDFVIGSQGFYMSDRVLYVIWGFTCPMGI